MHAARALMRGAAGPAAPRHAVRRRAALAHLIDVHAIAVRFRMRIVAHLAHVHDLGERDIGRRSSGTLMRDRPKPADLLLGRHRAFVPWLGVALAAVVDQREPLAFRVLEVERQRGRRARRCRRCSMPASFRRCFHQRQARFAVNAQPGAGDGVVAPFFGACRQVEESDVGAGRAIAVGIEQVIGADVVLVDGLLDQPHAERLGIESSLPGASAETAVRWWMPDNCMVPQPRRAL